MSDPTKTHPICQVCGDSIESNAHLCPTCETPHHDDCWEFNKGCSTYGCEERYKGLEASQFTGEPMHIRAPARETRRTHQTWDQIRSEAPPTWTEEDEGRLRARLAWRHGGRSRFIRAVAIVMGFIFIAFGVYSAKNSYSRAKQQREDQHRSHLLKQNIKALHHWFHAIEIGDSARKCWTTLGINATFIGEPGSSMYEKGRFTYPKRKKHGKQDTKLVVYIYAGNVVGMAIIQPNHPSKTHPVHKRKGMSYYTWRDLTNPRRKY